MSAADAVSVTDPTGAAADPAMPFLGAALDPGTVRRQFARWLPALSAGCGGPPLDLCEIRVIRHKPGRRCLVEYAFNAGRHGRGSTGAPAGGVAILGKARAKGLDEHAYRLSRTLWEGGFGPVGAAVGARVPEPLGVVPDFRMWFQRKAPGVPAGRLLTGPDGPSLAAAITDAVHQLHRAGVPARRRHTVEDEMAILHGRLASVADLRPAWSSRIARLRDACDSAASAVRPLALTGIHRDFYPDQVLVDESGVRRQIYLLDLDLYSEGDPALDIGNFLAHLTEQALREIGDPGALADRERAVMEQFLELTGGVGEPAERVQSAVAVYAALALARHVWISTLFVNRRPFTEALLELAMQRWSAVGSLDLPPTRQLREPL